MNQILLEIHNLSIQVEELKNKLEAYENSRNFENWIPRKTLMEFLNYGDTQMAALLKSGRLIVSEIGNRKFIKKESILQFLESNIK